MYNEEQKRRFIKERQKELSCDVDLVRFFDLSSISEGINGKDVCNFTTNEIIEMYKMINVFNYNRLSCINSQFLIYTDWCLHEHLVVDNQNHFLELKPNDLSNLINKTILYSKIVTRETILEWAYELPNPRDSFVLLALFETGKSKDFSHIVNMKTVDLGDDCIRLSDKTVKASEELINYARKSSETEEYISMGGKRDLAKGLKPSEYIYKEHYNTADVTSDFQKGRRIYCLVQRCLKYLGVDKFINPNALVVSGELYMIKTRAKELNMTPKEYLYSPYMQEVRNQYSNKKPATWYLLNYGDYLE